MTVVFKLISLTLLIFFSVDSVKSQVGRTSTDSLKLNNSRGDDILWSQRSNILIIENCRACDSLTLETTQGNILKLDNGMYSISGLKVGNVSLTIFKKSVGQAKLIFSKKFRVTATPEESAWSSLMPTPIISLGNLMEGKVNLDSLKNAQALIISKPYKLNSASFLLGHQTLHRIETENFDLSLKAKLKYLKVNDCISIFDIKVSDPNGNIYKFPKDLHYCAQ